VIAELLLDGLSKAKSALRSTMLQLYWCRVQLLDVCLYFCLGFIGGTIGMEHIWGDKGGGWIALVRRQLRRVMFPWYKEPKQG